MYIQRHKRQRAKKSESTKLADPQAILPLDFYILANANKFPYCLNVLHFSGTSILKSS